MPHFHGIHWGLAVEGGLGQVFIVERGVTKQGLFQVFATQEVMGLQDIRNATVEALDHCIGLWRPGAGQTLFDAQSGA